MNNNQQTDSPANTYNPISVTFENQMSSFQKEMRKLFHIAGYEKNKILFFLPMIKMKSPWIK